MTTEIMNTADLAELDAFASDEPRNDLNDMVATKEQPPTGISFHVSMQGYTMRDMEDLIIAAAAKQIIGMRWDGNQLLKLVEQKCMEMVAEKATAALASVTAEIIDQPMTPSFGDKKPVTMREMLQLFGREYLEAQVDRDGKPHLAGSYSTPFGTRMEWLVWKALSSKFKTEIERTTNDVVREVQGAIKAHHEKVLKAEKTRFLSALQALTKVAA